LRNIRKSAAIAAVLALGALAGCAQDFLKLGNIEPGADPGTYRWRTFGDMAVPHDSDEAEELRMTALARLMRETPGCADGYQITDRQALLRQTAVIGGGGIHDIYYSIDCR